MHLFRNRGLDREIRLEPLAERHLSNPATHVLSEPQPGRAFQSLGAARSAYEGNDAHQRREDAFCEQALDDAVAAAAEAPELVLIAPPHVMGVLRKHREHRHPSLSVREIVKDLAAFPADELTERLRALR